MCFKASDIQLNLDFVSFMVSAFLTVQFFLGEQKINDIAVTHKNSLDYGQLTSGSPDAVGLPSLHSQWLEVIGVVVQQRAEGFRLAILALEKKLAFVTVLTLNFCIKP